MSDAFARIDRSRLAAAQTRRRAGLAGLLVLAIYFLSGTWGTASAQERPTYYDFPRPQLEWRTIETDHFEVHYHEDAERSSAERSARVVAEVAEQVYEPITRLYRHRPDGKVSIVIKDFNDYANGAAYFFENTIEIWAPYLESHLRGDHHWLRNVVAHELTHIVQLQSAMKASSHLPFVYFQYFRYEDVRRPDVLYGYPNGLVSFAGATLNVPAWFAEGTAQYQRSFLHYDTWDTHRDMLLRSQVLEDRTLDLGAMGGFYSHNSLERESVYNHGFAFTTYLADRFGEEVLPALTTRLSEWSTFTMRDALEAETGVPGEELHRRWLDTLDTAYTRSTRAIRAHQRSGKALVQEGFSNYHPRFSPSGDRVAFVSNRGEDYNQMSLYVRDLADGSTASYELEGFGRGDGLFACRFGGRHGSRLVRGVSGSFTWAPDGEAIVYARKSNTWEGFDYADLYALDLESGDRRRLTRKRRATEPVFGPEGEQIAFVGQRDGSSDLYLLDLETGEVGSLTGFGGGTQVGAPVWHPSGGWIYFERTDGAPRDIWRIRPDGSGLEPVRERPWNERQPAFSPDGEQLVLASDSSGIYNLYRGDPDGTGLKPVTNVVGGAFMPAIGPRGSLAFARFQGGGYEIATLEAPSPVEGSHLSYEAPEVLRKKRRPETGRLAARGPLAVSPSDSAGAADAPAPESRSYEQSFSPFSVMPIYRLDMYAKDRPTAGGRFWRNSKAGLFFASREVLDRIRLSGSLALGLGSEEASSVGDFFSPSRLVDLERDAFLQLDYSGGLGFIPKRWSPQFSVALYNTRRNVNDGLAIEEFPCTACYPDTTRTDVSYSLWEADIRLRSKISRSLLVTLGYRYSPYQVTYESFYSRENRQNVPGASDQYFIGRALDLQVSYEALRPYRHADVLPQGIRAVAGYEYQPGRLLDRFALEGGQLVPKYADYENHRFWLETRIGSGLPGSVRGAPHGVTARLEVSSILGGPVDEFFDEYVGGLTGARGYPFYALGGNETAWAQIAYHVPIVPSIGAQLGPIYADKLYGRVYADAVRTWSGRLWDGGPLRTDVGAELRLGLGTFYLVPAAFFVSGTYGLDRFEVRLDEEFVTEGTGSTVSYGGEWLWHFGLLFNFDL